MIKGNALTLLYTVLAAFIGLCALLYLLQERLIFIRQPLAEGVRQVIRELPRTAEIEVTAEDGTRLHGWLRHGVEETAPRGLVIYFGGNAEEVSGQVYDADAARTLVAGRLQLSRLRAERRAAERGRAHCGRAHHL